MKVKSGVDFLVLCPLDIEVKAITAALGKIGQMLPITTVGLYEFTIPRADESIARVHVRQLPKQGNIYSGVTTTDWLHEITNCRHVISFGIAGTIDLDELKIEDVFVPRHVVYYEFWREQHGESAMRPKPFTCRLPEDSVLRVQAKLKEAGGDFEFVIDRALASGEKLFDKPDSELVARLRQMDQHFSAVDMEAAGVAAATDAISPNTHFFAVKGISDKADGTKNEGSADARRKNRERAARNAALVLSLIICECAAAPSFVPASSASIYQLDPRDGFKQSQLFAAEVARLPFVSDPKDPKDPKDRIALDKAHIFAKSHLPPVFYHWRQNSAHVHLVDLFFYAVLSHWRSKGYPTHVLVTDHKHLTGDDRSALKKTLDTLSDVHLSFFTEAIVDQKTASEAQAGTTSIVGQYTDWIDDQVTEHRYSKDANAHTSVRFWLNYIPFACRQQYDSPAAILLCWYRHLPIYQAVINCHLDFYPALISTPDLIVDGSPLKFGERTKDLRVTSTDMSVFADCVRSIESKTSLERIGALLGEMRGLDLSERFIALIDGLLQHVDFAIRRRQAETT